MNNVMKHSITVIFGDHGIHYGPFYHSDFGQNDRALPAMIIITPKSFAEQYPAIYNSMRRNQNRFTTHYQFHEMLKEIIQLNEGKPLDNSVLSLFKDVPDSYSCSDANIELFCACN